MPSSSARDERCGPEGLRPQVQARGQGRQPFDLALDEGDLLAGVLRHAATIAMHGFRHVRRQERRNVERADIAHRDREDHTDTDLLIGAEDDVQRLLVLRDERVHVLDRGDAVPQALERAKQRANAELLLAARPK